MKKSQTRIHDELVEKLTADFEDVYFWPQILKEESLSCFHRYSDRPHQFAGIDFELSAVRFDAKVKYRGCLNERLNAMGFEVSFIDRAGDMREGWFVNDRLSTDWYHITELSATVTDDRELSAENQLVQIGVTWIKKKELQEKIWSSIGSKDFIMYEAADLRDGAAFSREKSRKRFPTCSAAWLTYSGWLVERPVNLVVTRRLIESLPSTKYFIASRSGVRRETKACRGGRR